MPDLIHALQSGNTSLWIFIPTAILLGALHGLEPGHSKTMMAAFIIAIRGTIPQAVLLGLSAAISHSLIIWLLAAVALHFGSQWNAETAEPYLQIVSGVGILGLAIWMYLRTRRDVREAAEHAHSHEHGHAHDERFILDTQPDKLELSIFEEGMPPVFRLQSATGGELPDPSQVSVETLRDDSCTQTFAFMRKEGFLQSAEAIPEPHEFAATLILERAGQRQACEANFREHPHHHHGEASGEFQDAHQKEHAREIEQRFAGRAVSTPQIMLFGITGGLMPCPAAFSVLLICLQLKRVALGFTLVGGFSFGLAITMVAAGVIAAWSVRHAEKHFRGFGEMMRRAPYISCALLVVLASYMAWHGWHTLPH